MPTRPYDAMLSCTIEWGKDATQKKIDEMQMYQQMYQKDCVQKADHKNSRHLAAKRCHVLGVRRKIKDVQKDHENDRRCMYKVTSSCHLMPVRSCRRSSAARRRRASTVGCWRCLTSPAGRSYRPRHRMFMPADARSCFSLHYAMPCHYAVIHIYIYNGSKTV